MERICQSHHPQMICGGSNLLHGLACVYSPLAESLHDELTGQNNKPDQTQQTLFITLKDKREEKKNSTLESHSGQKVGIRKTNLCKAPYDHTQHGIVVQVVPAATQDTRTSTHHYNAHASRVATLPMQAIYQEMIVIRIHNCRQVGL
jgi:hypothetical protein